MFAREVARCVRDVVRLVGWRGVLVGFLWGCEGL